MKFFTKGIYKMVIEEWCRSAKIDLQSIIMKVPIRTKAYFRASQQARSFKQACTTLKAHVKHQFPSIMKTRLNWGQKNKLLVIQECTWPELKWIHIKKFPNANLRITLFGWHHTVSHLSLAFSFWMQVSHVI